MTAFSTSPFYNPAATLGGTWYRTNSRKKISVRRPYILEQEGRKQEIICSVILTLCLLFAFGACVVQFALS